MKPIFIAIHGRNGKMGKAILELLINDSLFQESDSPEVWIDFSSPEGTTTLLKKIDTPIVIGTTGFNEAQLSEIKNYSLKQPVLLSSNMSVGMAVIRKMLNNLPLKEKYSFDISMTEVHHVQKKDAPSGTALTLKNILQQKGYDNLNIQSVRAGKIVGEHSVRMITQTESITLSHEAYDRKVFAEGSLLAAKFLLTKTPALYTMDHVISLD